MPSIDLKRIRCVVWDLDETVWRGVLTEGGGHDLLPGVGELLELLQERGIFHSVASRNDAEQAVLALARHNIADYFVLPQIWWGKKSESLGYLIKALRLKSENLCLIDDSPFERDEVQSVFPDLQTLDSSRVPDFLIRCRHESDSLSVVSTETRARPTHYKREAQRIRDREAFQGSDSQFLAQCQIKLCLNRAGLADLPRIEELLNRSHQLNSNNAVFSNQTLSIIIGSPEWTVLIGSTSDRYGEYGRTAVMIGKAASRSRFEIVSFVVSCRVLGKGIAQALLSFVYSYARRLKFQTLSCRFRRSPHNRAVAMLFSMNGFDLLQGVDGEYYTKEILDDALASSDWVAMRGEV